MSTWPTRRQRHRAPLRDSRLGHRVRLPGPRFAFIAVAAVALAGCGGSSAPTPEPLAPAAPVPVRISLATRDLLLSGEPFVAPTQLVLDGSLLELDTGSMELDLLPGPHRLSVRASGYRRDLFALRFTRESAPRAQAVGAHELLFDVRPEDRGADLLLVSENLDVPFLLSLLDDGVAYRWAGRVDLHVDRSPIGDFVLSDERVAEIAAFVKAALEELSDGTVTLGTVTTGTGLDWTDFLHRETPGAITLQFGQLSGRPEGGREASGWARYSRDPSTPGIIASGNVILDGQLIRSGQDYRGRLGHEVGHALSLRHPACRQWSRMYAGDGSCDHVFFPSVAPNTFWSPADRVAGKLIYSFLPGTDFKALLGSPSSD